MKSYIIISRNGFFSGFTWIHPGTEKIGRLTATWSSSKACMIDELLISQTESDLKSCFDGKYKIQGIDL